jgi:NADH-quinone oxidoreductase subunit M
MPLLSLIIFFPALAGIVLALVLSRQQMKWGALAVMIAELVLVLVAAAQFNWGGGYSTEVMLFGHEITTTFQMRESFEWLKDFGISYTVGVDNLSMIMLVLTGFLGVLGVLCSWTSIDSRENSFYFFLLVLQTAIMGTFLALDLFVFYLFWELMLIPLYFMIGNWGSKNRFYATMKFVLYTLAGSVLMLLAMIWMYYNNGVYNAATNTIEYVKTYSYEVMLATQAGGMGTFAKSFVPFLGMFLAFAIKVPLFPLHTWLPDAHTEAPTAGSVILAGVLLKTGGYGMLRFCLPLFPDAAVAFAPLATWLAVIAIVYGAWAAIVQTDVKRLVAYSSVSHMGFVVLGIFSLNPQGMSGAILQMVNHGISTSGLFLVVGMIYERRHTREMAEFGGLAGKVPVMAALAMVMVLSSVGLPGLNGFLGEFNVLLGAMRNNAILMQAQDEGSWAAAMGMTRYTWLVATIATTGVIFGAVYLLLMYQRVFFGKLDESKNGDMEDLNPREWGQLGFLGAAALIIGLYPAPIFKAMEPATKTALEPVARVLNVKLADRAVAGAVVVDGKVVALAEESR